MLKILLFSVLLCLFSFAHPFYLSVCDLKYNQAERALQGTVKIFTSDLEDALSKITHKRTDLVNAKDDESTRALLLEYLNTHLSVSVNGKALKTAIIGFEKEEEALWIYVELKNCPEPKTIIVTDKILCDYLPQQMNIVHIQYDSTQKSLKAACGEPLLHFDF